MNRNIAPDPPAPSPIELWLQRDAKHPTNLPLQGDAAFTGPVKRRICTDFACCLIFAVFNAGLAALAVISTVYTVILQGDTNRLRHGYDFRAELCGITGLSDKPYMYRPGDYGSYVSVCLEACPSLYQASAICLYDTDHSTIVADLPCYDAHPSTPYGLYCIPTEESGRRDMMLSYLFGAMDVLRRGAGDLLIVVAI